MFTAARIIHSNPNSNLTIIAPKNRDKAASAAAGLMLNIFSEIDIVSEDMPLTKWKLKNWKEALSKWDDFFSEKGIVLKRQIFSSLGTKIYFDKNSKNDLERKSFYKLFEKALAYGATDQTKIEDEIFLPHEHSVDARLALNSLDEFAMHNCSVIDDYVDKIEPLKKGIQIFLKSKKELIFDKVVLAAGSGSSRILRNSPINTSNIPLCLNGVGSALEIFSELDYLNKLETKHILRSPNRGGTCGIHMVQRSNSIYVGASSVVTDNNLKSPRLGSVETLIKGAKNELGLGDILRQSMNILTGYRPISQDAVPVFGEFNSNLFLSYGHKRDGFTWAPFLSEMIENWINDVKYNFEFGKYLELCDPLRNSFRSFGSYEKSKNLFLLNEEFSYAQHNETFDSSTKNELINRFDELHNNTKFKNSVCHPELVSINYFLLNKLNN